MELKRLSADDAPSALTALAALKDGYPPSASADHLARFLGRPENVLLVASEGPEPLGFALAYLLDRVDGDRPMICLYEIGVGPRHRRHGIGTALVRELLRLCATLDATEVWTITNRSNLPASTLFEHTGGSAPASDDVVYVWEEIG